MKREKIIRQLESLRDHCESMRDKEDGESIWDEVSSVRLPSVGRHSGGLPSNDVDGVSGGDAKEVAA